MKKILILGSEGFIGKNIISFLSVDKKNSIDTFSKNDEADALLDKINNCDVLMHFAGVNRPKNNEDFNVNNYIFTKKLCESLKDRKKKLSIIFTSSTQVNSNNPYGKSKLKAEKEFIKLSSNKNIKIYIYRLPNVFGKWCRPNYNSVVATFCHNISRNKKIIINDEKHLLNLVYIDDVADEFIKIINSKYKYNKKKKYFSIDPVYECTVGDLALKLKTYRRMRREGRVPDAGSGFDRALYATFLSYQPKNSFSYEINSHKDERGLFSEFIKTNEAGQLSFFTAKPGISRGNHYHHTKNERFLVVSGSAVFKFKNIISGEEHSISVSSKKLEVVESIPGWAHNICNNGNSVLVALLWSNEVFNPKRADTIYCKV